jgi:DNA-binding NarL/FixJ family response regulator
MTELPAMKLLNGYAEADRPPVERVLRAAVDANRNADRAQTSLIDTQRRVRETIRQSRLLREEAARARELRANPQTPAAYRRDPLEALQLVAERLLVLTKAAEQRVPEPSNVPSAYVNGPLTARQLEILALVGEGVSTEEIARQLWLSVATVRNHVARTLRALDAHSRVEAVAKARRLGLL